MWLNFAWMLIDGAGPLRYSLSSEGFKLIVEVDPEITRLARILIPRALDPRQPKYPAHITVVRKEGLLHPHRWGAYEGEVVRFKYSASICEGAVYFWYKAWSDRLLALRKELGLSPGTEFTRPPDGEDCFHITVANRKLPLQPGTR